MRFRERSLGMPDNGKHWDWALNKRRGVSRWTEGSAQATHEETAEWLGGLS